MTSTVPCSSEIGIISSCLTMTTRKAKIMNTQARTRIGNCWLWVLNRHQEAMKTQMLKKKEKNREEKCKRNSPIFLSCVCKQKWEMKCGTMVYFSLQLLILVSRLFTVVWGLATTINKTPLVIRNNIKHSAQSSIPSVTRLSGNQSLTIQELIPLESLC